MPPRDESTACIECGTRLYRVEDVIVRTANGPLCSYCGSMLGVEQVDPKVIDRYKEQAA